MFTQLNYWMLFLLAKHQHRSFHKRKKCWQGRNLTYQTLMTRLEAQAWNGQSWIIITVELTIADDSLVLLDQGVPWDAIGFVLVPQVLLLFFWFCFCPTTTLPNTKLCNYKSRPPPARSRKIIYMQQVLKERLSTCNPVLNDLMFFQSWESKVKKGWNLHAWRRGFCAPNLRGPCLQWQDCARNP